QAPADVDHRDDLVAGLDDDRIADLGQRLVDPVDDVLDIGDRDREVAVPGADQEGLNHRELHWQAQAEDRAATGHRIDRHAALVARHRLPDDLQADAAAGDVVSLAARREAGLEDERQGRLAADVDVTDQAALDRLASDGLVVDASA